MRTLLETSECRRPALLTDQLPAGGRRTITIRLLVVSVLAAAVVTLVGRPALASCADPPDLETAFADAEVVFIGVVVEVSNHDRTAVMEVEQVWKGPQLPDFVTVHGGPDDPDLFTSVDRTFERETYVVFPVNSSPPFEDNACTLTQRTTTALDVINPLIAEPPEDPNTPAPVTTTNAVGASPTSTSAGSDGVVASEPEVSEDGTIRPWTFGVGIVIALLIAGGYAWRLRARRRS